MATHKISITDKGPSPEPLQCVMDDRICWENVTDNAVSNFNLPNCISDKFSIEPHGNIIWYTVVHKGKSGYTYDISKSNHHKDTKTGTIDVG